MSYWAHVSPEREACECGSLLRRLLSGNLDDTRHHVTQELKTMDFNWWLSFFLFFQPTVKINSSKVVFEHVSGKCVTFQFLVIRLLKTASFHR